MGNLQFVLTAVLGGALSVLGIGNITLGVMASYLQFTKSFTQPFMQVAQQFNSIVMALRSIFCWQPCPAPNVFLK